MTLPGKTVTFVIPVKGSLKNNMPKPNTLSSNLKQHPNILKIAKSLDLYKIDWSKTYKLTKLGSKKTSSMGYPDAYDVITAPMTLIGDDTCVWLLFSSGFNWFKTSPIMKITKLSKHSWEIETENSIYKIQDAYSKATWGSKKNKLEL